MKSHDEFVVRTIAEFMGWTDGVALDLLAIYDPIAEAWRRYYEIHKSATIDDDRFWFEKTPREHAYELAEALTQSDIARA